MILVLVIGVFGVQGGAMYLFSDMGMVGRLFAEVATFVVGVPLLLAWLSAYRSIKEDRRMWVYVDGRSVVFDVANPQMAASLMALNPGATEDAGGVQDV
jgi:hypothetical protein